MTSLNGVRKRRLTAKETSIANCEVLDEKHRIAVQEIFFPSLFVKNKPGKLVSSLVGCLLLIYTENRGKLARKILRRRKNRNYSILNLRAPSQIIKLVKHRVAVFSKTFSLPLQQK